jgi:hypothetical protein
LFCSKIDGTTSLLDLGMDSMSATMMSSMIANILELDSKKIEPAIFFEHPNLEALIQQVKLIQSGQQVQNFDPETEINELKAKVHAFTSAIPELKADTNSTILLTGVPGT